MDENKVLELLGKGIRPEYVAGLIGVTPGAISQLLAREDFAAKVMEKKMESLQAHTTRDLRYDALEDVLLDKMEQLAPMLYKAGDVLKAMEKINSMKRRGVTAEPVTAQTTTVTLNLPQKIQNTHLNIQVNNFNQVVSAGGQELVTMQSSELLKQAKQLKGAENDKLTKEGLKHLPLSEI